MLALLQNFAAKVETQDASGKTSFLQHGTKSQIKMATLTEITENMLSNAMMMKVVVNNTGAQEELQFCMKLAPLRRIAVNKLTQEP